MEKKQKINVYELINTKNAVSTEDGNILFITITKAIKEGCEVTLDFGKLEIITTTFLNAAIGQLYNEYDSVQLRECLKLENIANGDLGTLKKVTERAKQYFKNQKNMTDTIDGALNG